MLRRYLPGSVAEHLARGGDLEPRRAEVSVLFADLRGFSTLAEQLSPEETLATVSRFNDWVSALLGRHGGTIVDFFGDGVMAVFGAPDPLAEKETAATTAAREIADGVGTIGLSAGRLAAVPLQVGVGVATGEAMVGNVRALDRVVWTALGTTTNLAARLQALSRELRAAIVVDAATHRSARYVASEFRRMPGVPIRGLSEPRDLWILPLADPEHGPPPRRSWWDARAEQTVH